MQWKGDVALVLAKWTALKQQGSKFNFSVQYSSVNVLSLETRIKETSKIGMEGDVALVLAEWTDLKQHDQHHISLQYRCSVT